MKHYLSICSVCKNEVFYIKEWLEFGILQGVEHYFIYDNGSTDGTLDILNEYKNKGFVTLYSWPEVNPIQFKAYNHCLTFHGKESVFIGFLDCDEFLLPGEHLEGETIISFLKDLEDCAGIAVNWEIFGSNGHLTKPEGLVIENYTRRQADLNPHVKSIMQPSKTAKVGANPHFFIPRYPYDNTVIDEYGNELHDNYALQGKTRDFLKIHHYHTKSKAEYFERKSTKPDPGLGVIRDLGWIETSFAAHDRNDVEDLSAVKFAPIIREKLCLS